MDIKGKSNIKNEIRFLKNFIDDFSKNFPKMADKAISGVVSEIRSRILDVVKSQKVDITEIKKSTLSLVRKYDYFKYEKDLIKDLLGEDLAKIALNKDNLAYNTFGLDSNIHVMQGGFIRSFRRVSPDASLEEVLEAHRNSLSNGLIIDKDSGEIFILGEELSKNHYTSGVKLFCSTSRGVTPWSEAVFNKYKTGQRKVSGLEAGELAVPLTLKKADLDRHLKKAIPLGSVLDLITEGKYDSAKAILEKAGKNRFQKAIGRIEDMKTGGENLPEETKNLSKVINTVKDIKVTKYIKKEKVEYRLNAAVDSGSASITSNELFELLYPTLMAYIPDIEKKVVMSIVKAIEDALKKYEAKAK